MTPDPKNVRDALLTAGYSPAAVDFGIHAMERHEWHEKDEDNNEVYWATIQPPGKAVPYVRSTLSVTFTPAPGAHTRAMRVLLPDLHEPFT